MPAEQVDAMVEARSRDARNPLASMLDSLRAGNVPTSLAVRDKDTVLEITTDAGAPEDSP
jgi:hypothetical protein